MLYLEAAESALHICFSRSAKDPFIFPHEPDLAGSWQAQRCSLDSLQHGMRSGQRGKRNSWVAARHREQTQQGLETFFPFLPFWFTQWDFVPGPGGASCCGPCCRCTEHMGTATAVLLIQRSSSGLPLVHTSSLILISLGGFRTLPSRSIFPFPTGKNFWNLEIPFPNGKISKFPFSITFFFLFFFFPCHSGKI